MLQLQGANSGQMSVISFGEELPAASGQSESAWSQNLNQRGRRIAA